MIFTVLLDEKDLIAMTDCKYDTTSKEFQYRQYKTILKDFYIIEHIKFYYDIFQYNKRQSNENYIKYEQVLIDFLPYNAKKIKIIFYHIIEKLDKEDKLIDNITYPCQYKMYVKYQDKEIEVSQFTEREGSVM